jgi:allantoinase
MKSDPGLYDYWPYIDRPKLTWPGGKSIAFWVAPNIENYEMQPPPNPHRMPMPRPVPDVIHYSHRDYGNRVGFWRMAEAMNQYGVRGSGMNEAQERAYIEDVIASIQKHTGQRVAGSLTPALTHTERSIDLLAEYGFRYVCDLFCDNQPIPLTVSQGRMISVPYSVEMNDFTLFNGPRVTPRRFTDLQKAHFDQLLEEGAEQGAVMCIPTHPFLLGRPFRIDAFAEALEYITGHKEVWVTTGREIADHYMAHYYDDAVAAIAAHNAAYPSPLAKEGAR